jgi:outer membrane protein OmpA-like peptidoglycan-associated protein
VFYNRAALSIPGSTGLGTSRAVIRALRSTGHAELGLVDDTYATSSADSTVHPNIYDYRTTATVQRVAATVMVPVLVNGARVELPAIQARGDYIDEKAELLFLDDDDNPLTLRYRIGDDALDVVQIHFDCTFTTGAAPAAHNRIEQALLATGRADVYSIFFAFNSAELRQESDSTLREIDDVLRRHPGWKLAINGDNVGGDAFNLALSERRAAAVKSALVTRFGAAPARLTTAGYGERQPKATNTTLEGRAENRRVELVRLP